jgi:hypothetical protein
VISQSAAPLGLILLALAAPFGIKWSLQHHRRVEARKETS